MDIPAFTMHKGKGDIPGYPGCTDPDHWACVFGVEDGEFCRILYKEYYCPVIFNVYPSRGQTHIPMSPDGPFYGNDRDFLPIDCPLRNGPITASLPDHTKE